MKLHLCLTTLLSLAAFAAAAPKPVELILSSKQLDPTTTFEIRFADPMVAADRIGQPADSPPVVFQPAVKGRFTWLSERSGIFAPDESLPLSTTFQLGLAPGIAKADGSALDADFHETVQTPPMQLKGSSTPFGIYEDDATAEPKYSLLFNVNVDPAAAAKFCKFVDKTGAEIPAHVVAADPGKHHDQRFPLYHSNDQTLLTWTERFSAKPGDKGIEDGPRGDGPITARRCASDPCPRTSRR